VNITAIVAVRNEAAYIARFCEHLAQHGATFVIIDNESTDETVSIARTFRNRGLVDIVAHPYPGYYDWTGLLRQKEHIARTLDSDWFLHLDADEIPEPPERGDSLRECVTRVDAEDCNIINFDEFVFLPTANDELNHGQDYVAGLPHYYFFEPQPLRLMRGWKKNTAIDLSTSGGHQAMFPDQRLYPRNFVLRHYIALSRSHLVEKYVRQRRYAEVELARGWHAARSQLTENNIRWPSGDELLDIRVDGGWDRSKPRRRHLFMPADPVSNSRDQSGEIENPHAAT